MCKSLLSPFPWRSGCFMQPVQLHAGLLYQTWVLYFEPPMFLRLEGRGCRLPFGGQMQVSKTFCKHLVTPSPSSWFYIKVKGSEQNTRDCVPTQGEIHFTLFEPAITQVTYFKAAVQAASVINWKRKEHLVGKSAHPNICSISLHSSMGGIHMVSLDEVALKSEEKDREIMT